jgi:hypothetical protein
MTPDLAPLPEPVLRHLQAERPRHPNLYAWSRQIGLSRVALVNALAGRRVTRLTRKRVGRWVEGVAK